MEKHTHNIPDIDIIDLEETSVPEPEASDTEASDTASSSWAEAGEEPEEESGFVEDSPRKKGFRINMHMVLLAVIAIVVCVTVYRFHNWGNFISQDEIRENIEGSYEDTLDLILPLTDENNEKVPLNTADGLSIVFFGNAPFADDRDSEDNLVNMIGEMTGATTYNCAVSDSYLAAEWPYFSAEDRPMDAYTLYWLSVFAGRAGSDTMYDEALAAMGEDAPADAQAAYETLRSVDFSTVDVIAIMYDAYDYLLGHPMYSDENSTDITQFTGNLEAGIEFLQATYPHIRIIVMSPTYAYSNELDEDGNYISSDIIRYGWDVLSTYAIKEYGSCASRQVTFVDNLYGTITEDNAGEYLIDNLHLNVEGRRKVAQRFIYALNYYDKAE